METQHSDIEVSLYCHPLDLILLLPLENSGFVVDSFLGRKTRGVKGRGIHLEALSVGRDRVCLC
jgi:hypothetical protein